MKSKICSIRNQNFAMKISTDFNFLLNFRGICVYSTAQTLDAVYIIGYWTKNIVAEAHGSITIEGQTMIIGGYFNWET